MVAARSGSRCVEVWMKDAALLSGYSGYIGYAAWVGLKRGTPPAPCGVSEWLISGSSGAEGRPFSPCAPHGHSEMREMMR